MGGADEDVRNDKIFISSPRQKRTKGSTYDDDSEDGDSEIISLVVPNGMQ